MNDLDYFFIVNPIAGGTDKTVFHEFIHEKQREEDFVFEIYETTGDDDEQAIKKVVGRRKVDVAVAVGGDGTLRLAAMIFKNTGTKLAVIPFGSANGMARELGIPSDFDRVLSLIPSERIRIIWAHIQRGKTLDVDMVCINGHYSMHLGDIGLNAKIVKRFESEKIRGYFGYARQFFKELSQRKAIKYELSANGKTYGGSAYMIVVANAKMYGSGAVINPIGALDDGRFEVCIVKDITFAGLTKSAWSIFKKDVQYQERDLEIISAAKARIKLSEPQTLQVDGEIVGDVDVLEIKIVPGCLKMII